MPPNSRQAANPKNTILHRFFNRHRTGLRNFCVGVAALGTILILYNFGFWWLALLRFAKVWQDLSDQTKLGAIGTSVVVSLAWLLKKNFTMRLSWAIVGTGLLRWLKGVAWIMAAWVVIFLFYTILIAPPKMYSEISSQFTKSGETNAGLAQSNGILARHNSELSNQNDTLKEVTNMQAQESLFLSNANVGLVAANSNLKARLAEHENNGAATNWFTKAGELATRMEQSAARQERAERDFARKYIDTAKSNQPIAAAIDQIIITPIEKPKLNENGDNPIDPSEFAAIDSVVDRVQAKKEAEALKQQRETAPLDGRTKALAVPVVDYYVGYLEKRLRELAAKAGVEVTSTFNGAATMLEKRDGWFGYETLRVQGNPGWDFHIYFRKENDRGAYNLLIYRGSLDFTCQFNGTNYSYYFRGGPAETSMGGSGKIAEITETNFVPALKWLIGLQNSQSPLMSAKGERVFK